MIPISGVFMREIVSGEEDLANSAWNRKFGAAASTLLTADSEGVDLTVRGAR